MSGVPTKMDAMPVNALCVVSELAASQHNVFTRSQAAAEGVRRDHLRRLIIARTVIAMPSGGLVLLAQDGQPSWLQRVTGAVLDHPGTFASHTTAARLDGTDGYDVFDEIELSVLRPRVLRIPGVTVHRVHALDRCDTFPIGAVPCTNRARTLCDLGNSVEPAMVRRALQDALRRGTNERWLRATAERLHRPGQRGTAELVRQLRAHAERGRVPDSWFEQLLDDCLDDPRIGLIERQHELRDDDNRLVARFDLAVPEVKLGIEAHSRKHHFVEEEEASDEHRDHAAAELGWDVAYLGYSSLESPASVARRIARRVEVRRAQLGSGA